MSELTRRQNESKETSLVNIDFANASWVRNHLQSYRSVGDVDQTSHRFLKLRKSL